MTNFHNMSDKELAEKLNIWRGDALLSWESFSDHEKSYFRRLEDEACRRFINEHTEEAADDTKDGPGIGQ